MEWLTQHKIPIGKWARTLFDWLQGNFSFAFDALSDTLEAMIEAILWLLQAPPPLAIIALFIPFANFYTTNDDEFAYRVGINEFNFLGRSIMIGGFFQRDIYNSHAFNFRAPFLFSRKLGLSFNYQSLTTLEPVFFDNTTADYKYNNTSYELLGLYQLNFKNRIELGLNLFTEDYQYQFGATNPNIPQELVVDKSLIKFIYEYNALDYYYESVSGFRSLFNFQYVRAEGNILPDFSIWWNDFFYYKRVGKNGNWANRLRIGFATNDDSPFAPFSVDNNINVRGVGNIIDRGTGVIVLNTEYRHILYNKNNILIDQVNFSKHKQLTTNLPKTPPLCGGILIFICSILFL